MSISYKVQKAVFEKRVDDEPLHQEYVEKFKKQLEEFMGQVEPFYFEFKKVLIQDDRKAEVAQLFKFQNIKAKFFSTFVFSNYQNLREHVKRNPEIDLFDFMAFMMLSKRKVDKNLEEKTFLRLTIEKSGPDWLESS